MITFQDSAVTRSPDGVLITIKAQAEDRDAHLTAVATLMCTAAVAEALGDRIRACVGAKGE